MIFAGLATLLGGLLSQVLAWLAAAVGVTLATIFGGVLITTVAMMPTIGPWLTMPWIPWIAIGHCVLAMMVGWSAALVVSFIVKFGVPMVSMGWIKT